MAKRSDVQQLQLAQSCINYLFDKFIYEKELFRNQSSLTDIRALKNQLFNDTLRLRSESDPHLVVGVLLSCLKELSKCLCIEVYDEILKTELTDAIDQNVAAVNRWIVHVPAPKFDVLRSLLSLLSRLLKEGCDSTSQQFAFIIAPYLCCPVNTSYMSIHHQEDLRKIRPVISFIIERFPLIFTNDLRVRQQTPKSEPPPPTAERSMPNLEPSRPTPLAEVRSTSSENELGSILSRRHVPKLQVTALNLSELQNNSSGDELDAINNSIEPENLYLADQAKHFPPLNTHSWEWKMLEGMVHARIELFLKGNDHFSEYSNSSGGPSSQRGVRKEKSSKQTFTSTEPFEEDMVGLDDDLEDDDLEGSDLMDNSGDFVFAAAASSHVNAAGASQDSSRQTTKRPQTANSVSSKDESEDLSWNALNLSTSLTSEPKHHPSRPSSGPLSRTNSGPKNQDARNVFVSQSLDSGERAALRSLDLSGGNVTAASSLAEDVVALTYKSQSSARPSVWGDSPTTAESPKSSSSVSTTSSLSYSTNQSSNNQGMARAARRKLGQEVRSLRSEIAKYENEFFKKFNRSPKVGDRSPQMAAVYDKYRVLKRNVRDSAAKAIQRVIRGFLTRKKYAASLMTSPVSEEFKTPRVLAVTGAVKKSAAIHHPTGAAVNAWDNNNSQKGGSSSSSAVTNNNNNNNSNKNNGNINNINKEKENTVEDAAAMFQNFREFWAQKHELKRRLKKFDDDFLEQHGRAPNKSEKEVMRPMYDKYHEMKNNLDHLKSKIDAGRLTVPEDVASLLVLHSGHEKAVRKSISGSLTTASSIEDLPSKESGGGNSSSGKQVNFDVLSKQSNLSMTWPGPAASGGEGKDEIGPNSDISSLSSEVLAKLNEEKKTLHAFLKAYERDFTKAHGKPVMKQEDILPVANEYRRYKDLKGMLSFKSDKS